jgi:hypothetical protein
MSGVGLMSAYHYPNLRNYQEKLQRDVDALLLEHKNLAMEIVAKQELAKEEQSK